MAAGRRDEQNLVAGLMAGEVAAFERFLELAGAAIWPVVVLLVGEGSPAEDAFLSVITALKANNFARLAGYRGRSRLSAFLVLVARDVLGEEAAQLFALDRDRAGRRFDHLFARDIRLHIRDYFPRADEARRDDLFQKVHTKLLENDFRRIRAYGGKGHFTTYILKVVDNLLIDIMREEAPRRRLPAEIERLPKLHQLLFVAGAWNNIPIDPDRMALVLQGKINPLPGRVELLAALDRVSRPIAAARSAGTKVEDVPLGTGAGEIDLPSPGPTPEEDILKKEEDKLRQAVLRLIRQEAMKLPSDQRFYLQRAYFDASEVRPPREIAREMAIPVEEVYKLEERTKRWLEQISAEVRKNASLSV